MNLSATGDPTSASGLELQVIAAVVIGGGSLSGGEGTVLGTLIGCLDHGGAGKRLRARQYLRLEPRHLHRHHHHRRRHARPAQTPERDLSERNDIPVRQASIDTLAAHHYHAPASRPQVGMSPGEAPGPFRNSGASGDKGARGP